MAHDEGEVMASMGWGAIVSAFCLRITASKWARRESERELGLHPDPALV